MLVVAGGPRTGDVESGVVAAAAGTQASVVSGGLLCMLGVAPVVLAFPAFWRYEEHPVGSEPEGSDPLDQVTPTAAS
jgi:hypothetical protein